MNFLDSIHGVTELTHWGLIRAQGSDAATFLHGQLTNDFKLLGDEQIRLAGYCSPKGRLLASLLGWRAGPDEIWLACHRSVLPSFVKQLSMFVLRAQCRLSDLQSPAASHATQQLPPRLWGLSGSAAEQALQAAGNPAVWELRRSFNDVTLIRLPDAAHALRALWVSPHSTPQGQPLALDTWRWLEVESGIPTIEQATSGQFVPQMVNLELLGGVNFQKGCYPGQEVVARSQYRGTVKRRMFLFDAEQAMPPPTGQEVFSDGDPGQPAGQVVNAAAHPDGQRSTLLVEVKLSALQAGALRLGAVDGLLLQRRPLPYAVPLESEGTTA